MKIMIAYDGSMGSREALNRAIEWGHVGRDEFVLAMVLPAFSTPSPEPLAGALLEWRDFLPDAQLRELEKQQLEANQEILDAAAQKCEEAGFPCKTRLAVGVPRTDLCTLAENEGVELLVIGSRGLGTIKRILLGSVSDYVLHHAPCTVMIVKAPSDAAKVAGFLSPPLV